MKIEKFEDIQSWIKGRELVNMVYDFTSSDKFNKDWGLRDQLRRASISIISNIAEGFERNTDKEFKQFLYIAKGSCGEVRAQLYIAYDQKYIDLEVFQKNLNICVEISKMISKFIMYLDKK